MDTYIKNLESEGRKVEFVDSKQGFILRLDGHSFSRFTRHLEKPYDIAFSQAMIETALELRRFFNATTSYTHSDEITLYFPSVFSAEKNSTHSFGGKVTKLITYSAGLASTTFTLVFTRILLEQGRKDIYDFVCSYKPHFDSRIMIIDNPIDFAKHDIFRSQMDCFRNTISGIAMYFFSKKSLHKISTKKQLERLKEKGVVISTIPFYLRHGIYIKTILIETNTIVNEETIKITRKRPVFIGHRAREDDETVSFLTSKYFEGNIPEEHIDFTIDNTFIKLDLSKDFDAIKEIQSLKE